MRRFLILFGSLCWLLQMSASTEITLKNSYPEQDAVVSYLDHLTFEVDYSEVLNINGVSEDEVGLVCAVSKRKKNIKLYEGDPVTGTLLETVYSAQTFVKGNNTAYWKLSKTYSLEDGTLKDGQLYTIVLSKDVFYVGTSLADNYDTTFPETTITFHGGEDTSFGFSNCDPVNGSELKELGVLHLYFNSEIGVATGAMASLYNGSALVKSAPISVSSENGTEAMVDFGNEILNVGSNYTIKVAKESIFLKDDTLTTLLQNIQLIYKGDAYKLFDYATISPAPGSVLSKIGKLTLVPDFPEGATPWQYAGDDAYSDTIKLYKGVDEAGELIGSYVVDLGTGNNCIQGNVSATLEPNVKYALILPEGLVPVTYYASATASHATVMPYWHSAPRTLIYTGANTALDGKWSVTENDQLSKLGIVSFMTGGTATANEGAKILLYNGEDSIASATLNASGTLCYADFGGLALEQDGDYSLVIPDSAIVNMPKTTQKFKGITKPAEYATVSYKSNGITVASEQVLKGSKVFVDMAMPDSIQLDSLMLNGEKVALADSTYAIDSLATDAEIEAVLTYIPTPAPETVFYDVNYNVMSVVNDSIMPIASSTTKVAEDSVFTFKAPKLDENWSVEVSAGELTDSTYSLAVTKDTAVVVTCTFNGEVKYVDETASGVYTLDNNQEITISTTQGKIVVEGANAGDIINLYGLNGAKLGNWEVKQDKQTIDVNSGVYLVVVKGDGGKAAAKVSVK